MLSIVDVATPASREVLRDSVGLPKRQLPNAEWIYTRQHKSGLPNAMQVQGRFFNTGLKLAIYHGPGFTGAVDITKEAWFQHCRPGGWVGLEGKIRQGYEKTCAGDDRFGKSGSERAGGSGVMTGPATNFSNFRNRKQR